MSNENIVIKGAKENNLKNIDVTIPRDKMIVMTGLSGSGKSSLAFDTIYADGQRRYMESLSSYARMFLGQMQKPDVDYIEGLSPAVSIDQKTTSKNPRSTVGTVTEIYDYLRLMYARIGKPHCPKCGREIDRQTVDQIADKIMSRTGAKTMIIAPVVRGRKGEYRKELEQYKRAGYVRVRIDGNMYELEEEIMTKMYELKHPRTGKRLVQLAVRNKDAVHFGLGGPECGDIIFFKAEGYTGDHGDSLSTAYGVNHTSVSPIFVGAGPGFKENYYTDRIIRQVDFAPTISALLGVRMPAQCEGAPAYQILDWEF